MDVVWGQEIIVLIKYSARETLDQIIFWSVTRSVDDIWLTLKNKDKQKMKLREGYNHTCVKNTKKYEQAAQRPPVWPWSEYTGPCMCVRASWDISKLCDFKLTDSKAPWTEQMS